MDMDTDTDMEQRHVDTSYIQKFRHQVLEYP